MDGSKGPSHKNAIKGLSDDTKPAQSLLLPPHWFLKQSRTKQGRIYYANAVLKTTTWDLPSFVPCPALCDECQEYQSTLKATKKNGKKKITNPSHHVITSSKMTSQLKSVLDKPSTKSVNSKSNLKLSQKLKKTALFVAQSCNASKKYSTIKSSKVLANQLDQSPEDSVAVSNKSKEKVLRAKRFDVELNVENSSWSPNCISTTSDDSLQKKHVETTGSITTKTQRKSPLPQICQEKSSLCSSSTADLINHLPSNVYFPSVSQKPHDSDSPSAAFGAPSTKVSFVINSPTKLSAARKRSNSPNDEDFSEKINFKKHKPSRDLQPSLKQSKFVQPPHPLSRQCSDVGKLGNISTALPSSTSYEGLAEQKILLKEELTKNKNNFSFKKVEFSEKECKPSLPQCTTSTISHVTLPSDDDMEVDISTELRTIRRANSDHKVDTIEICPPSQLDILNSHGDDCSYLYAVIDTNVLISHLQLLNAISLTRTANYNGRLLVVVIPYTALQELDSLKSRESLSQKARAAIRWCHDCFSKRDASAPVRAQSFANYRLVRDTLHGVNGDDHIRDCCLFLQQQGYSTMLLSDDINLRNKALVADITALDSTTLAKIIGYTAGSSASTQSPGLVLGDRSSTSAASAKTRHHTYVVKSNKETSSYRDASRTNEQIEVDKTVNNELGCLDRNASFRKKRRGAACLNLNDVDDPMEGISSPSISHCANNTPKSLDISSGSMSVADTWLGDESRTWNTLAPRPDELAKCTCMNFQDNEQSKTNSVLKSLETTLGNILKFVMETTYGDLWIQIVKLKPPWTLTKIFNCWKKHWMAVFMDKFPPAFENQLKTLHRLTSSEQNCIEPEELERNALELYNYFDEAPYKEHVQLPERNGPYRRKEVKTCPYCASKTVSSDQGNSAVSLDKNENRISLSDYTMRAAKEQLIKTGNRMGEFVSAGVTYLSAGTPQSSLLGPINALRTCIESIHASFIRCQKSHDAASADELSAALLQFWINAKEGEYYQQLFFSSEAGRGAVRAFMLAAWDTDFIAHCLAQLQRMQTYLDAEISKAAKQLSL